jgi:hypothetical protein
MNDAKPFDLADFDNVPNLFEEGIVVDIVHPVSGVKIPGMWVKMKSYSAESVRALGRKIENKRRLEEKKNPRRVPTVEQDEERYKPLFIAAVTEWGGFVHHGKPLDCTPQNVEFIADHPQYAWIVKQCDTAASDDTNYFR